MVKVHMSTELGNSLLSFLLCSDQLCASMFVCVSVCGCSNYVFVHTILYVFNIFLCFINSAPLSSWPVIPISFQQVQQPSLLTLSYLSQFARAAVRMEQVTVAPHNSSYRREWERGTWYTSCKQSLLDLTGWERISYSKLLNHSVSFSDFKQLPLNFQFIFLSFSPPG